jgi:hypothetical protein
MTDHDLLLRLAGRVPDDGLAVMRTCLADGEEDDLARLLVTAAGTGRLALTADEADLIRAAAAAHGLAAEAVDRAPRLPELPFPRYRFTAGDGCGPGTPAVADHKTAADQHKTGTGSDSAVAVEAAGRVGGLRALWRVCRHSGGGRVRLHLGEAGSDADVVELVAEMQHSLAEAGHRPLVEIFAEGAELPPYHQAALAAAELVWTAEPPRPVRVARVFDGADPARGPFFRPDHPRLSGDGRARVLAYLRAGEPVLLTPVLMDDVLDADRVGAVPMAFRSDGAWIWADPVAYYLERYHLAPEPDLVAHALTAAPARPLSRLAVHLVLTELCTPAPDRPDQGGQHQNHENHLERG